MHFNSISVSAAPSASTAISVASSASAALAPTGPAAAISVMTPAAAGLPMELGKAAVLPELASASPPKPASPPPPSATSTRDALVEASNNLLKHIPGEASGFYLLAVDSIKEPSLGNLGLIFALAFVLLVVVRWLAKASAAIMITTILAFALWMLIFDKGFLHVILPSLLPAPMGLIVAVFYSMLITLLASAGKIR
ncbi:MAG: hypothetical protein Q7R68_01595 [Nitrospirales bacterium]|nr:hypothetical protein [Nitrospirales bacterium]